MPTRFQGVPARVLMTFLSLALTAGIILAAQPASAAGRQAVRQADPLAAAAAAALAALGQHQEARAALARSEVEYGDPWLKSVEAGYDRARTLAAAEAAPRAGLDVATLDNAWAAATTPRMVAVLAALSQVGVPYRTNTSQPGKGFDCSGLTTFAWGVAGVSLPRNSSAQISSVPNKPLEAVEPGDLVQYPGHVMMALGAGTAVVHAPQRGKTVEVKAWSKARRAGSPLA